MNDRAQYDKEVKRWKRWTNAVLIATPVLFALGIIDTISFKNTGNSIIHPYLDMFFTMIAFALFVTAAAARLRWFLMTDAQKNPKKLIRGAR